MNTVTINIADENEFFRRGRELAQLADLQKAIPAESMISFEDPAELLKLLIDPYLTLFRAIKEQPDSITALAERLGRDVDSVKHDVGELEKVGIVRMESQVVRLTAEQFKLEAVLA
ncbi:HVO_A0114 family putative DNA-binding protein [Duganella sp. LjRoot269]|jgi:predicted transcriptional regulator|uniref:HVO_A0114 family putative DNA-binding protein n=1 Tax=Duganella sp. LjRoot269 TaxID=3342305 RepID=UPI003ECE9D54